MARTCSSDKSDGYGQEQTTDKQHSSREAGGWGSINCLTNLHFCLLPEPPMGCTLETREVSTTILQGQPPEAQNRAGKG